jgi:hypothetical protein
MKKIISFIAILILTTSCIGTKSTLKNVNDNAPSPKLVNNDTFLILEYSKHKKYV